MASHGRERARDPDGARRARLCSTRTSGRSSAAVRSATAGAAWARSRPRPTESRAMSKDLKRRGFRFVGPTVCYAFMQATGMVNDHETSCFRYRSERLIRRDGGRQPAFERPFQSVRAPRRSRR
ncbi:MAG: DNA-3-methyladenine glycosylase I [Actinomycetota bacterium]